MRKTIVWILIILLLIPAVSLSAESKSDLLRERADNMWDTWAGTWSRTFLDGEVYLPRMWKKIPFVTWADEAPEIHLKEENGKVEITLDEILSDDWRICLSSGIPMTTWDCIYDPGQDCWRGEGEFDTVCLISEMSEDRLGVRVYYDRKDDFRPSCPVVEWSRDEDFLAMNCYGWGTTREFQGGMYAIASNDMIFYAEYDKEGVLSSWYDMMTGCQYDKKDQLVSGEEPEGYVSPVVH